MRSRFRSALGTVMALSLLVTACSDGAVTSSAPPEATTSTAVATTQTTTTLVTPTSAEATTTTTQAATTTSSTIPGTPIEVGPSKGDRLGVIGVAHDDVLNVRRAPGTDQAVVATLEPTADHVIATGAARKLTSSIWFEVTVDGTTGWVGSSFVAYLGVVDDTTSAIVAELGEIPVAETMLELGTLVAETVASIDPPSKITIAVAPSVGDLGEITMDVVGLGDDSVTGLRLHVFGMPTEGGEGFSLGSVEQTILCGRGVTAEGICV